MAGRARADGRVAFAGAALVALALIATPLVTSVGDALTGSHSVDEWQLWWPSVSFAAIAAVVAVIIGLLGHFAASANRGGAYALVVLVVASSCALPSYVHALAWSWILPATWRNHGSVMAISVLGVSYAPVTFLVLAVTLRALPERMIEAAWLAGLGPLHARMLLASRTVPALLAAWLVAFLLCFSDFAVADYFRVSTYATEVFARVAAWMDPSAASRLALPILVTAIILLMALSVLFRRLDTAVVPMSAPSTRGPARPRIMPVIAGLLISALIIGIPIVALASRVPDAKAFVTAGRALLQDLPTTLVLGALLGSAAALLGASLAYLDVRRVVPVARFARFVVWGGLAWPASLISLGAISLFASVVTSVELIEWLPMMLVLLMRWVVLAYEVWRNFWVRMSPGLEEACWLVGIPWWRAVGKLLGRHGGATFGASVLLVACLGINDLTVFVLLAPPGFSTTTLNIFSAVHYGPNGYLAALCLWQVSFVLVLAAGAVSMIRRVTLNMPVEARLAHAGG